jgi:hypothetical protein
MISKRGPAFLLGCAILPGALGQDTLLFHSQMCDASAGVALGPSLFVAANDEDNTLRFYRNDKSGPPVLELPLSGFLEASGKWPEVDLEGAARIDSRIYWIGSHGRNKDGKFRENRHRLFATKIILSDGTNAARLEPEGLPYRHLMRDLLREPRLRPFNLAAASNRAPKEPDALNIEGLGATPERHLLIGFRNPIPQGKALLVPLLNPEEVIQERRAQFGDPILLDLHGLGIRDIAWHTDRYYLIAGTFDGKAKSRLYQWAGPGHPPEPGLAGVFTDFNPEAIVAYPENPSRLQLLSDDGTLKVGGEDCKLLKNPAQRSFRSLWVTVEAKTSSPR